MGQCARVVFHHRRYRRYSKLPGRLADQRTGQTIPSRVEGGTCNDEVRTHLSHRLFDGGDGLLFLLHEVIVPGDYGRDYRPSISQYLVERPSRADGSLPHLDREIVRLFASNACEELIDVVQRSNRCSHGSPPRLCGVMLSDALSDD